MRLTRADPKRVARSPFKLLYPYVVPGGLPRTGALLTTAPSGCAVVMASGAPGSQLSACLTAPQRYRSPPRLTAGIRDIRLSVASQVPRNLAAALFGGCRPQSGPRAPNSHLTSANPGFLQSSVPASSSCPGRPQRLLVTSSAPDSLSAP